MTYPRTHIEPAHEAETYDALGRLRLRSEPVGPEGSRTVLLTRSGERPPSHGPMVLLSVGLLRSLLASARSLGPHKRKRRRRQRLDIRI